MKPPGEEMVASGNFCGNTKILSFPSSVPPLLSATEEESLQKGELLGLSRPW